VENENEILWTSGFINERLPAPISPLGWSHIGPFVEELALRDPLRSLGYPHAETLPLTRLWRGHPYANARAFQIFYRVFPDFLLPEDAARYFPDGDVSLRRRASYPRWMDAPRLLFSLLRTFLADPFNVSPLHNYRHWARYTREHDARTAALRARLDSWTASEHTEGDHPSTEFTLTKEGLGAGSASPLRDPREVFDALREAEQLHRGVLRIHRWSLMDADLTFGLLKRLVAAWIDRAHANDLAARLVADVPNKTLEVDAALREMRNDKLQMKSEKWRVFLAEHGHRSFSIDIAAPTFAEEPAQIRTLLGVTEDERGMTNDGSASSSFVPQSGPSAWFKKAIFGYTLALARRYLALREDQRYYWQKSLAAARRLYLMLAERLRADSVIAERNAVFYATHQELAAYFQAKLSKGELADRITARQAEWHVYQREFEQSPSASYPAFLRDDIPLPRVGAGSPRPACWRGRAISPGIARGVARVVPSAGALPRVQRGDILIAPATDPAWTPVFARLAGLVVERGGVLSHSAVVAREYHIPAVAGIANIVAEIQEGEVIEVDGSRGIVSIV